MRRCLWTALFVICYMLLPFGMCAAEGNTFEDQVSGLTEILDVRVNEGADKVRIVVDADREISFQSSVLSNPQRIVVDVKNAWLSKAVKKKISLDSRFVSKVRIAQHDKSTVRIVVESTVGKKNYDIFTLSGGSSPGRLVMDFGNLGGNSDQATIRLPQGSGQDDTGVPPSNPEPPQPVPTEVPEGVPHLDSGDLDALQQHPANTSDREETGSKDADASDQSVDEQIARLTGLKGRKITIDPGHGGSDSGAIGPTGIMEKDVTLRVSMELKKLLEAEGATVYMTRTKDIEVSPKRARATDIEELQARCDIANQKKSDIFISIHMDSFTKPTAHGTTGYYYTKGSRASYRLADCIRMALIDQIGTESRGTQTCEFYVVRHTDMPATLIEVAFISNPKEEKLMNSKEGIKKAAQGIADGIADYFG